MGDILIWQGGGNYVSGVRKARNGVGWRADWPGWPLNHLGITHPGHPSGRLRRVRGSFGTLAACRGEGQQGGSSNVPRYPADGEAVSRRAAALLLNFMVP